MLKQWHKKLENLWFVVNFDPVLCLAHSELVILQQSHHSSASPWRSRSMPRQSWWTASRTCGCRPRRWTMVVAWRPLLGGRASQNFGGGWVRPSGSASTDPCQSSLIPSSFGRSQKEKELTEMVRHTIHMPKVKVDKVWLAFSLKRSKSARIRNNNWAFWSRVESKESNGPWNLKFRIQWSNCIGGLR